MPRALPVLLLALAVGCRGVPIQDWYTAGETYTTVLNWFADQREAGKISDADYTRIEAARVVARTALDEWETAIAAGEGTLTIRRAASAVRSAIDALLRYQIQLKASAQAPGVLP